VGINKLKKALSGCRGYAFLLPVENDFGNRQGDGPNFLETGASKARWAKKPRWNGAEAWLAALT